MSMRWLLILIFVAATGARFLLSARTAEPAGQVRPVVITVSLEDEAITPVTARHIIRAIQQAEQQHAECLVIVLDTPGGLVDSTRDVVNSSLRSSVPVVVYVSPAGARAASAGVFITLAAHVAAMAPGTTIGAAHPVQIGGLPGSPPQPREVERQEKNQDGDQAPARPRTPMEEKVLNNTVSWARTLAELRGRNAEWAARAVRESVSVPASVAAQERAIDLLAEDLNDLLARIDGREVALPQGSVNLRTAGAEVRVREMWWGEKALSILANPTLAFLLLMLGFYGILFEFSSPGWGVSGTVGVICLVLGFFALAVLPINYVGLVLIAIALALFMAEAFVPSFGFLTAGGLVCLIIGGLMLIDSPAGFLRVSLWALVPVALATAAITFFLVGRIVKAHRAPIQTGGEVMSAWEAVAEEDFTPDEKGYSGLVLRSSWKLKSMSCLALR
jgi:membrane-bound serine protease (ClpP class)